MYTIEFKNGKTIPGGMNCIDQTDLKIIRFVHFDLSFLWLVLGRPSIKLGLLGIQVNLLKTLVQCKAGAGRESTQANKLVSVTITVTGSDGSVTFAIGRRSEMSGNFRISSADRGSLLLKKSERSQQQ